MKCHTGVTLMQFRIRTLVEMKIHQQTLRMKNMKFIIQTKSQQSMKSMEKHTNNNEIDISMIKVGF